MEQSKQSKYIFVTGGVVSSLGKGVAAASIGALLQSRGYTVHARKFDPYLNVDPGAMSPLQHGEVFITADGHLTDLDLGYYERFLGIKLSKNDSVSGGRIYWDVLNAERNGVYGGGTVQMIPHVSDKIKEYIGAKTGTDFVICEIGGTVGDIEGKIFLESIRQFAFDVGRQNVMFVHLTLAPYLEKSGELKTKPTQMSVRELLENGIQADMLIVRTPRMLDMDERAKIGMFCNLPAGRVISGLDVNNIYQIPSYYDSLGVFDAMANHFDLPKNTGDMSKFQKIENYLSTDFPIITIGLVGRSFEVRDAYKSVSEALFAAGVQNNVRIKIKNIIPGDDLSGLDGILFPGDFDDVPVVDEVAIADFARENNIPYFGIGLGLRACKVSVSECPLVIGADKNGERHRRKFDSDDVAIDNHKFFKAVKYHPEFNSSPYTGHPLFNEFVKVCKF
jgi:CTP synthase